MLVLSADINTSWKKCINVIFKPFQYTIFTFKIEISFKISTPYYSSIPGGYKVVPILIISE